MFCLYDVYDDIAFPGGILLRGFVKPWSEANNRMDRNVPPSKKAAKFLKGVLPVDDDKDRSQLNAAVNAGPNYDVYTLATTTTYRDDTARGFIAATVDTFSPHRYRKQTDASGAALFSWSGWYDGAYQHSAIKRFLSLSNPQNKLMLGPWNHGGDLRIDPSAPGKANYPHLSGILRFFDYHLKDQKQNGQAEEARVFYYTMAEGKWKSSNTWPPANTRNVILYLNGDRKLERSLPAVPAELPYKVDTNARTGVTNTRWAALRNGLTDPVAYGDRRKQQQYLLTFDTEPLAQPLTVTGHPLADIYLTVDTTDATLFVYLEDVHPDGTVHYVTEGELRALHRWFGPRPTGADLKDWTPPVDAPGIPYRDYTRAHGQPLQPGEPARMYFDILPTSYQFKAGHRLRVGIAGCDEDNFQRLPGKLPTFRILTGGEKPSQVVIPVEE
jgi:putative CocE/NonD family hydrolase